MLCAFTIFLAMCSPLPAGSRVVPYGCMHMLSGAQELPVWAADAIEPRVLCSQLQCPLDTEYKHHWM